MAMYMPSIPIFSVVVPKITTLFECLCSNATPVRHVLVFRLRHSAASPYRDSQAESLEESIQFAVQQQGQRDSASLEMQSWLYTALTLI
ncbi:hypothetical protein DVH24_028735 [Malus domestica]|uniref:Uncharacterized protein n=1 Tax=Malus domestica TaxID=3750 RepID=A0A498IXZ0_MALDO|nr:hypothetical protein DVH24_028735 [Malus domestica]